MTSNLIAFENMTKDEFLGRPKITKASNAAFLVPSTLLSHDECNRVPFPDTWSRSRGMSERNFEAVYCKSGAAVLEGDKVIASYHFGDTLVVDKKYRRQGIGLELAYQFRTRFPDVPPAKARTKASQALQIKLWVRIQLDVARMRYAREAAAEVESSKATVASSSLRP